MEVVNQHPILTFPPDYRGEGIRKFKFYSDLFNNALRWEKGVKQKLILLLISLFLSSSVMGADWMDFEPQLSVQPRTGQPSGTQFCMQAKYQSYQTCVPGFTNTSSRVLKFQSQHWGEVRVPPDWVAVITDANKVFESMHYIVRDDASGAIIFDGYAMNKMGIRCIEIGCVDWKL